MPSRRSFVATMASTCLVGTAGCLFGNGSWLGLVVRNEHDTEHTVAVTATGDFDGQTVERTVPAGESASVERFVPQLDYDHVTTIAVEIDGTDATTVRRRAAIDVEEFTVVVTGDGSARVEPQSLAVTDTPAGNRTTADTTAEPTTDGES